MGETEGKVGNGEVESDGDGGDDVVEDEGVDSNCQVHYDDRLGNLSINENCIPKKGQAEQLCKIQSVHLWRLS